MCACRVTEVRCVAQAARRAAGDMKERQADGGSLSCESQRLWRERIHAKGASAATLAGGGPAYVGVPRGSGTCSPFLHETHKTHRLDKREANVRRAVLMVGRGEQ